MNNTIVYLHFLFLVLPFFVILVSGDSTNNLLKEKVDSYISREKQAILVRGDQQASVCPQGFHECPPILDGNCCEIGWSCTNNACISIMDRFSIESTSTSTKFDSSEYTSVPVVIANPLDDDRDDYTLGFSSVLVRDEVTKISISVDSTAVVIYTTDGTPSFSIDTAVSPSITSFYSASTTSNSSTTTTTKSANEASKQQSFTLAVAFGLLTMLAIGLGTAVFLW